MFWPITKHGSDLMARIMLVVLLIALQFSLACDGRRGDSGDSGPSRQFLSFGTAPPGGAFFVVGGALAEVINETGADRGYSVIAEATSGSQENIRRLATGELDFALSNAAITYFAVRGLEGWDLVFPMQSVMTLAPNIALFVTPAGSGIDTLADLKNQRVTVGVPGAGFEYFVRPILAAHGVTYDDFSPLEATQQAAVDMLTDGSAAAAFLGGAVPTASIAQASALMDITLIPFGEDEKQILVDKYLFFRRATIPANTYRNQTEPYKGLDVGSMHFITAASADEELVYTVTKLLYENRARVVEKHSAGRAINPTNVIRDTRYRVPSWRHPLLSRDWDLA